MMPVPLRATLFRARSRALWLAVVVAVIVALAGCRDRTAQPVIEREKVPPRRVIDPPGTVRPLPPYAISNTGVGPYQLGASLANVLYELPSGPRMVLLDVPGLLKQNVIRAEDDGVLVSGAVLGDATVIAVVSKDVARTESGIAVGGSRAELGRELRQPGEDTVARDPRLLVPLRMPAARLVMQGEQVAAVVLRAGGLDAWAPSKATPDAGVPMAPARGSKEGRAAREGREAKAAHESKGAGPRCPPARPIEGEPGDWFAACLSAGGEIVRVHDDEVSVRTGADGKERLLTQLRARGLVFAATLRSGERPDDRDELVVVTRTAQEEEERAWSVALYHLESGRLVRVAEDVVYRLTAEGARWIGISLEDVELYLEVRSRDDAAVVGGLLVTRVASRIRDVVALREVDLMRRRGTPPSLDVAVPPAPPPRVDAGQPIDAELLEPDASP